MKLYEDVVLKHFDKDRDGRLDAKEQASLERVNKLREKSRDEIMASGSAVLEALSEMWLADVIDQNFNRLSERRRQLEQEMKER